MPKHIVYLITGAIGAGKTTFSRHLLPLLDNVEYIGADYYFYPFFWTSKKEEYLCYEDSKVYTKYKIDHAMEQGRSFALEKTFSSDSDFSLLDLFIQKDYQIITFYLSVDCLDRLISRSNNRGKDGWYYVPEEKVARHWRASKGAFETLRMKSHYFYAIDTSDGYKLALCEENKKQLYINPDCSWLPLVSPDHTTVQTNCAPECSPFFHSLRQLLCNIRNPECQTIINSMKILTDYSILEDDDWSEIDRIKSNNSLDKT